MTLVASRRMMASVRELSPKADIQVMPSGIDLSQFVPMDRKEARVRLGEPLDDTPWVLFVTINPTRSVKRIDLAQAAMKEVRKTLPHAKFKVLSTVPHEQMPTWMNASHVLLLTSTHEGWPNVVKEALACNLPFVSTDVGDLKCIADAEPSCRIAEADSTSIASAVVAAVHQKPPVDLRRHSEPMDIRSSARRLIHLYERVLSRYGG